MKKDDLLGKIFGRVKVMRLEEKRSPGGDKIYTILCLCGCLSERVCKGTRLRTGKTKGLRCSYEKTGHYKDQVSTRTYISYKAMKQRCYNKNNIRYSSYGGRGIKVCDQWLHSFATFLKDMGERPAERTLDRIDVEGDYTPNNCRWATREQQDSNRRKKSK